MVKGLTTAAPILYKEYHCFAITASGAVWMTIGMVMWLKEICRPCCYISWLSGYDMM